jgi:uncharacterized membrane protein YoaK (UPF0700 family)
MTPARHLALGMVLTAAVGMIDAVGFIELGGYYTSFMSGNTTQLGAGMAEGMQNLLLPAGLVILFVIGSFLGSLIASSREWRRMAAVLCLVLFGLGLTITLSALGYPAAQSMLVLAASAGAQNAILVPRGSVRLGTTFVTGTLFGVGQDLARAVRGEAPAWRWAQHLLVWVALLVGALLGALAYGEWRLWALLAPGAIYLVFLGSLVALDRSQEQT